MRRNLVTVNLASKVLKIFGVAKVDDWKGLTIMLDGKDISDMLKFTELVIDVESEN